MDDLKMEKIQTSQITEFRERFKWNKYLALAGVVLALILSCVIIRVGLCKDNLSNGEQRKDKVVVSTFKKTANDTTCCMLLHKEESVPTKITEINYDNTTIILLYISIIAFVCLSLWGGFSVLIKVLKSENEIISKIFDVQKDIYKEQQMTAISNNKKKSENSESKKEYKKEYDDIKNKINLLEESIDVMKTTPSNDEKNFLEKLKGYLNIIDD